MIDRVSGLLLERDIDSVVVEVGGLGLRVAVAPNTGEALGPLGSHVTLLTEFLFVGSQDPQPRLFGFATHEGRSLFHLLRAVSGIGPSTALRLLGAQPTPGDVAAAIARGEVAAIKVKGVGPKLAKRVVTELKDKVGAVLSCLPVAGGARSHPALTGTGAFAREDRELTDAFLALKSLEFDPDRARALLVAIRAELAEADADQLVREVLLRA